MGDRVVIFASIGSQLPFDRFVRAVDEWSADNPQESVFIQIGDGAYEPRHAQFARVIPVTEYRALIRKCDLFMAHVGMGSILQGLEECKQMLLMPRLASLGEHTTDHQLHTAQQFRDRQGVRVVDDTDALKLAMTQMLREPLATGSGIPNSASRELIDNISGFLAAARK